MALWAFLLFSDTYAEGRVEFCVAKCQLCFTYNLDASTVHFACKANFARQIDFFIFMW